MADSITGLLPGITTIYRLFPNWIDNVRPEITTTQKILSTTGIERILSFSDYYAARIKYTYHNFTKADEYDLLDFYNARQGRREAFWILGHLAEFGLMTDALLGDAFFHVQDNDFVARGFERIYLLLTNGDLIVRKVTSTSTPSPGTLNLFIDTVTDRAISAVDIQIFGFLYLARFDIDKLELSYPNDRNSKTSVTFVELPADYAEPNIGVTAPNGGEVWQTAEQRNITWSSENFTSNVKIELYKGGGLDHIIDANALDAGEYTWTIPQDQTAGTDYKVRISSLSLPGVYDDSNGNFEIAKQPETVTILSPNGGEVLERETSELITWTTTGFLGNINIKSKESARPDRDLALDIPNTGSYLWAIPVVLPNVPSTQFKIRIEQKDDPFFVYDYSDADFTINYRTRSLTITYPTGGENFVVGQTVVVTWTSVNIDADEDLTLTLHRNSPTQFLHQDPVTVKNTGSYAFLIENDSFLSLYTRFFRIRRDLLTSGAILDDSEPFEIDGPPGP